MCYTDGHIAHSVAPGNYRESLTTSTTDNLDAYNDIHVFLYALQKQGASS